MGDSLSLSGFMLGTMQNFGPAETFFDPWYYASNVTAYKGGVGGTKCSDTLAAFPTTYAAIAGLKPAPPLTAFSITCGQNDYVGGRTEAAAYADILSLVTLAQAKGMSVIVDTIMDSIVTDTGAGATWRNNLNTLIRNGAAGAGYVVADAGADATLGCTGCYLNATYFNADGIHLVTPGWAIKGGLDAARLTGFGFN